LHPKLDEHKGELVCDKCGEVVQKRDISTGMDVRIFADDDRSHGRAHVGQAYNENLYHSLTSSNPLGRDVNGTLFLLTNVILCISILLFFPFRKDNFFMTALTTSKKLYIIFLTLKMLVFKREPKSCFKNALIFS
jgi:transcription initiation factor TFIIIB Brf1 subunit/transcription initiation factor TFIIB